MIILRFNTRIAALVLLLIATSGKTETLERSPAAVDAPSAWHILGSAKRPLKDDTLKQNYSGVNQQYRAEFLYMGDNITIDSPIYSSGGDIIIYAAKLKIAAPIDSRVYLSYSDVNSFHQRFYLPERAS